MIVSKSIEGRFHIFCIVVMSFFIFGGYYAGLTMVLSTGNILLSKIYTLPIRIFCFLLSFLLILKLAVKSKLRIRKVDVLMLFLFFLYVIKVLYTETTYRQTALRNPWYYYILYFIFFNYTVFSFFRNIDVKNHYRLIINTILHSSFIFGISLLLFYRDFLFSSQVGRFGASMEDTSKDFLSPLALAYAGALNISILIPLFFNNFKDYSLKYRIYLIINFLMSMFLFVMGSTRGALVVVLISILFFIIAQKGLKKIKYFLFLIPLAPVFVAYLIYTNSSLIRRITESVENKDTSGRDDLWANALKEFSNFPILGGKIEVSGIYPHNIILEILMGMGVVGLFLFLSLLFVSFSKLKLNNETITLIIIFINGFFQYMFSGSFYTCIILFFSIGLLNGYKINFNNKIKV